MRYIAVALLLFTTPATAQVSALPANQFMATPLGSTGFLAPRVIGAADINSAIGSITGNIGWTGANAIFFPGGTPAYSTTQGMVTNFTNASTTTGYTSAMAVNTFHEVHNSPNIGTAGIFSYLRDDIGWNGVLPDNFNEAVHAEASIGATGTLGKVEGVVAVVGDGPGAISHHHIIGFEAFMSNNTTAPVSTPSLQGTIATAANQLAFGYLSGTLPGSLAIDAHYMVNPYPGVGKAQTGFLSAGDGLTYAGFADTSTTAQFGVSLIGSYSSAAINIDKSTPNIRMNKTAISGQSNQITGNTTGLLSWIMEIGNNTNRSGANAGDDFDIARFNDAGAFLDFPFTIFRSTGQLQVNDLRSLAGLRSAVVAVASLPTCNAGLEGTHYGVNNALAPVALATVAGGGTVHVSVYCNGTNWIVN